ncbi:hypothetical protein C7M52_00840 [Mixta theicola]|nr:hypothetical protein C7M52_00840 [Mixta theicola]
MINLYSNIMSSWPASIVMSPKLSRLTPSIAQIWDYERISPASAVGSSLKSLQGAIGEYLERKHFFNEIVPASQKKIVDMMPESWAQAFIKVLKQTSAEDEDAIKRHTFNASHVVNMFTLEKAEIPTIFITLENVSVREDCRFYPFRDTCGCSCHVDFHQAVNGSLGELLERQALLIYWLTGVAKEEIRLTTSTANEYIGELIRNLRTEGSLTVLDITLPGAPGYVILSLYGTHKKGNSIQYGAGLSYSMNKEKAVEKSLIELWQSYICMHNFIIGDYEEEELIDRYQIHFMKCNKYETYRALLDSTTFHQHKVSTTPRYKTVVDYFRHLTPHLFLYCAREKTPTGMLWYTKALSPDLFMHMDNSSPVNLNNSLYTQGTGLAGRERVMVPFP